MSSRVLSAYFDDFRKGKKQREELRRFMEDAIGKEPMRRGHFMGWLDQAQYEHPIPVTEFLLLRKEIEATLDNDDQTRIDQPLEPIITSPDADTLVAGDEEATIVAPSMHAHQDDATEVSLGSQPSDMARLHDVPTLIGTTAVDDSAEFSAEPADHPSDSAAADEHDATMITSAEEVRAMTMPSVVTSINQDQQPRPHRPSTASNRMDHKPSRSFNPPNWMWLAGALILGALVLGYWGTRPMATVITEDNNPASNEPTQQPITPEPAPNPEPVFSESAVNDAEFNAPTVEAEPAPQAPATTEPEAASQPSPLTADLSAADALILLKERADQGLLLPLEDPGNAHEVLRFMQAEYPLEPELSEARVYLKDIYVAASKKAQGRAEWDDSQLLLDAAFEVLSPASR